jgi:hypothetical protein
MKKNILSVVALMAISLGMAQNVPIDFETGGNGASWNWTVFENDPNAPLEIIPNPVSGGINTSAMVAKFTTRAPVTGDGKWAGFESEHGAGIGTWTPTASNSIIRVMVYQVGYASTVSLKFATVGNAALPHVESNISVADQWVEHVFDMSSWIGAAIGNPDQIVFHPDNVPNRPSDRVLYIDNVTFDLPSNPSCTDGIRNGDEEGIDCGGSCPNVCTTPAPTTSAPLSATPESDILYLYSDQYVNPLNEIPFNNPSWASSPPSNFSGPAIDATIAGISPTDNIKRFDDLSLAFSQFATTDLSTYNYFHIDVWSTNATSLIVKIEGAGPGLEGNTSVNLTRNQWNSVDINLNNFGGISPPANRTALFQLIFDAAGGNDFYFDNVYFSKTAFLSNPAFAKASFNIFPNPAQNNWSVISPDATMQSIKVFDVLGKQVLSLIPNNNETEIDGSSLKSGLYFAQIKTELGVETIKLIKN